LYLGLVDRHKVLCGWYYVTLDETEPSQSTGPRPAGRLLCDVSVAGMSILEAFCWDTGAEATRKPRRLRSSASSNCVLPIGDDLLDDWGSRELSDLEMKTLAWLRDRERPKHKVNPQQRDEVKRILRAQGKLQDYAQRRPRRVRKVRWTCCCHQCNT
jgi:hypothetical protein